MSRPLAWILAAGLAFAAVVIVWSAGRSPAPPEVRPVAAPAPEPVPAAPPVPEAAAAPPASPGVPRREEVAETAPTALAPDAAPARALLRGAIDAALAEHLDRVKLSPDQLDTVTDAAWTLRTSREALRALPPGPEHADERRALVEASAEANAVFTRVLGMTPGEFTDAVQPDVGVDRYDPDEVVPEPEFIDAPEHE